MSDISNSVDETKMKELGDRFMNCFLVAGVIKGICPKKADCSYVEAQIKNGTFSFGWTRIYENEICKKYYCACELNLDDKK